MIQLNLQKRSRLRGFETKLCLTKGKHERGGINYGVGIDKYTLLYVRAPNV